MPPFWHPFGAQNRSKNRSEIRLLKKSPQDRSKTAQDRPKMPPDPPGASKMPSRTPLDGPRSPQEHPRSSQEAPRTPPRPPNTLPRCPPDPSGAPKKPSRTPPDGPQIRKPSKKGREKKGRQRSSTVVTRIGRSKTESTFKKVEPKRVAAVVARSALSIRRPRPQASSACCKSPVETFFQKVRQVELTK